MNAKLKLPGQDQINLIDCIIITNKSWPKIAKNLSDNPETQSEIFAIQHM